MSGSWVWLVLERWVTHTYICICVYARVLKCSRIIRFLFSIANFLLQLWIMVFIHRFLQKYSEFVKFNHISRFVLNCIYIYFLVVDCTHISSSLHNITNVSYHLLLSHALGTSDLYNTSLSWRSIQLGYFPRWTFFFNYSFIIYCTLCFN